MAQQPEREPFRAMLEQAVSGPRPAHRRSESLITDPPSRKRHAPRKAAAKPQGERAALVDLDLAFDGAFDPDRTDPELRRLTDEELIVVRGQASLPPDEPPPLATDVHGSDTLDIEDQPTRPLPVMFSDPPWPVASSMRSQSTKTQAMRPAPKAKAGGVKQPPVVEPMAFRGHAPVRSPFDDVEDSDALMDLEPIGKEAGKGARLPVAVGMATNVYRLKKHPKDRLPPVKLPLLVTPTSVTGEPHPGGEMDFLDEPPREPSLDIIIDVVIPAISMPVVPKPGAQASSSPKAVEVRFVSPEENGLGVRPKAVGMGGDLLRKGHALYLAALEELGRGDKHAALVHLKLAVAYDGDSPLYRDLMNQLQKASAKPGVPAGKGAPNAPGPSLLVISRDGSRKGLPQVEWVRSKQW